MDNLSSYRAQFLYVLRMIEDNAVTEDDEKLAQLMAADEVCHACQPIRHCNSDEIQYQYITLRYGEKKDHSVFALDISDTVRAALDLFALYLAVRQTQFELETFHPDLLNNLVFSMNACTLLRPEGKHFIDQLAQHYKRPMSMLIPSLHLTQGEATNPASKALLEHLEDRFHSVCFDVHLPVSNLDYLTPFAPQIIKISNSLDSQDEKRTLLPVIRYIKRCKATLIAGRVTSQNTLSQYKMLGAKYYFGYVTDVPIPVHFKGFEDPKAEMRKKQRERAKEEQAAEQQALAEQQLALEQAERDKQQALLDASIDNMYQSAKTEYVDEDIAAIVKQVDENP